MHKMGDVDESTGKVFLQMKKKGSHRWEYWVTPEQYKRAYEIMRKSGLKWVAANKERERLRSHSRRVTDPAKASLYTVLCEARRRAKEKHLPFALKYSDINIPEHCPVLGIPLFRGKGKQSYNSPSLDRIVPELGYVPSNVVVVSLRANRLKSNASLDELRAIAKFYLHL